MSDNVIPLQRKPAHLTCECGSAWWNAQVCIEGQKVTGYGLPLVCVECGKEGQP
ncbi:hypothetical protein GS504_24290 [Rhodococcus hoagii]|uniref:Uncharacterized protein n=1 Tax=Rhodococcus hoagii TaxID=43767 RepID=A0AAE3B965_RHOHA|nr:hypothetical protein [Prescottella equi]MBM4587608.1 hypothetical protein [Prescottella equi]MBM4713620.1 hypothetical protein [Prescottella equi]NKS11995.1 hypothetical protein [Prescottella equi]NKS14649.1 hypothetical protein [Prescottella equi]